jgi:hypothetical protein
MAIRIGLLRDAGPVPRNQVATTPGAKFKSESTISNGLIRFPIRSAIFQEEHRTDPGHNHHHDAEAVLLATVLKEMVAEPRATPFQIHTRNRNFEEQQE